MHVFFLLLDQICVMATNTIEAQRQRKKKENFLRQFRDEKSKEMKQLTAAQFMEIWSHYDLDGMNFEHRFFSKIINFCFLIGNGFIEGHELDNLLRELASSVNTNDAGPEVSRRYLIDRWIYLVF
jgi:hypothetical protein